MNNKIKQTKESTYFTTSNIFINIIMGLSTIMVLMSLFIEIHNDMVWQSILIQTVIYNLIIHKIDCIKEENK